MNFNKSKIINASLIILILYILEKFGNYILDPRYKKIKEFETTNSESFIKKFFTNPVLKLRTFRELNCKNVLFDNMSFSKNENPFVSVIITIYNQANCFHCALRSVQNQSLKNIEIIIVDDCSLDNSTEMIKEYMKEDNRIIYLKHEINEGKIKSRTDGVKIAKGRYITIIDGDDSLSNEFILYNCFSIANLSDLHIIEFNIAFFSKKQCKGLTNYNSIKGLNNRIIFQPELSFKFVDFREKEKFEGFRDRNIVSKLIKNDIFQKIIEFIGSKYTNDYLLDYEDTIMSVSLFRIAESYYFIKDCGYYYAKEENEAPYPILNFKKCRKKNISIIKELEPIKYLNFLLDIYKGKEVENYLLYKELITIDYRKKLNNLTKSNFSYVYNIIDKINEINHNDKHRQNKISKIKNKLIDKEKIIKSKLLY